MAKRYDTEFKLHAVKQVTDQGKTAAQVSRELDIAQQTLSKWIQKYKEDQSEPFVGSGNLRSEDKSIRGLKRPISMQKKAKAKRTAKIKRIHIQSRDIYGSPKLQRYLFLKGE